MDRQVDINRALGMVERDSGERLAIDGANGGGVFIDHLNRCSEMVKQWPAWKVGVLDYRGKVVVDPPRDEVSVAESHGQLEAMRYATGQHDLACKELGINLFPHEDGDTLIEAVCRLKEQLATVTRERDESQRKYETQCQGSMSDKRRIAHLETTVRNYQSAANKIAVELNEVTSDRDALREQLATVQRVLVESLNLAEVGDEFAPPCVDVDNAMSLAAATEVAIDTLKLSAEKHKLDAEEANKALATVQARRWRLR